MKETDLAKILRRLPAMRIMVKNLDNALTLLTPEERLIANLLLLYPKRNNIRQLCDQLNLEEATAYRRRKQILRKLTAAVNSAPK